MPDLARHYDSKIKLPRLRTVFSWERRGGGVRGVYYGNPIELYEMGPFFLYAGSE